MLRFFSKYGIKVFLIILVILSSQGVYAGLYIDETGREVNIPSSPKRIVSLAPSITETLFALGLDEEIVGVTTFSDYPEAAKSKPRVGSFVNISLEKVVSLNPDLIIGTAEGNKKEMIEQLERIGFPVYMINPASLEEIFKMVLDIGRITGRNNMAKGLVRTLRERVSTVVSQTSCLRKPRVFFQIGIDPIVPLGEIPFTIS